MRFRSFLCVKIMGYQQQLCVLHMNYGFRKQNWEIIQYSAQMRFTYGYESTSNMNSAWNVAQVRFCREEKKVISSDVHWLIFTVCTLCQWIIPKSLFQLKPLFDHKLRILECQNTLCLEHEYHDYNALYFCAIELKQYDSPVYGSF